MAWKTALRQEDLWVGEMVGKIVGGRPVLLVNVDGNVCAYEDRCLHRSLPLSQGKLEGNLLTCRAHAWEYDACSGQGVNPEGISIRRYDVRVEAGHIMVDVDEV